MAIVKAWAAKAAKALLEPFEYESGPLGPEEVEIAVEYCGICHSDLSMLENDWGITIYPFVPGHEAVGSVIALGELAREKGLKIGQRVGVGWNAGSCLHCSHCIEGDQQLCENIQATIVNRHGAFANRVKTHWIWAVPIPDGLNPVDAGPLLCGGITVFAPLLNPGVRPTDRVGVIGIGGLGHMALKFLKAWGCETTAFTSNPSKYEEARSFGATHTASSTDAASLKSLKGALDLVLVTVNVPLDWNAIISLLAPKGRLLVVGAVPEPIPVRAMHLIGGKKSVSGSPTGSRAEMDAMLRFAALHKINPKTEHFPMNRVNEAMEHLRSGKANYRIVLDVLEK